MNDMSWATAAADAAVGSDPRSSSGSVVTTICIYVAEHLKIN